ncbi:dehydrogenase [Clostridia bacterium]|nr:dehydrogenase [Clostridia bacterium]
MNVAMLSKWHVHAGGYANEVKKLGHNIPVVWDDNKERGQNWAKELGAEYESDLAKVLARADVEAVVVDTETSKHYEVIIAAAKAKKHIFTEKTLAPTKKEALEIKKAIEDSGKIFTISFPHRTYPATLYAKSVVDSGVLGTVNLVRLRNAHSGASSNWLPEYWYNAKDACGGAMMDLGCHPMYIANYLLGTPARITSMFNATAEPSVRNGVEDNAVNLIEFKNKAIAIVETGFVTGISPWAFEVYGTNGTLFATDQKVKINTEETRKYTHDFVEVNNLPKRLPEPLEQFFDSIEKGAKVNFDLDAAVGLAELLEGAYIAHKTSAVYSF